MPNSFSLSSKVAIITGASSGLGWHFAKTLARAGAKVIVAARRLDKLKLLANEIIFQKNIALPLRLDVTDEKSIQKFTEKVEREVGKVDILVNAAGMDIRKSFFEHTESDWDLIFNTNLKSVGMMTLAIAKLMIKYKSQGSIINVSSAVDSLTYRGGSPAYMASKAGVSHLTQVLALDLAEHNIRVNAIAPAGFRTQMTEDLFGGNFGEVLKHKFPLQRYGELQELDGALLLLASDTSSYITGSILRVDGGISINKI